MTTQLKNTGLCIRMSRYDIMDIQRNMRDISDLMYQAMLTASRKYARIPEETIQAMEKLKDVHEALNSSLRLARNDTISVTTITRDDRYGTDVTVCVKDSEVEDYMREHIVDFITDIKDVDGDDWPTVEEFEKLIVKDLHEAWALACDLSCDYGVEKGAFGFYDINTTTHVLDDEVLNRK